MSLKSKESKNNNNEKEDLICPNAPIITKKPDFKYNYIDHYSYKSVEEFAKKILKTDAIEGLQIKRKYEKIDWYFGINILAKNKIDLLENITKLNLSNLRLRLN